MASDAMCTIGEEKGRWVPENWCQQLGCAGILYEQGNDCVGCASRISMTLGSDVTSCINLNLGITPFFTFVYLK
jgi:hypothetical protein